MAATSESLYEVPDPLLSEKGGYDDDLDSLPSISTDEIYSDDEDYDDDAQAEWERSLEQIQMLLTMVIVPFVGKYFGRKFAYWSWGRYMNWAHDVQVTYTDKKAFRAIGAVEAARSL
ncbi:hypothetical protein K4F52_004573 [Lecanicillium sp. MT-2017a]|nr:hypothetical protein K4F52_004573 [Lecanicillium sp. MT-2017a]